MSLKLLLMFGSYVQVLSQISMAIYFLVYDKYLYCNEPPHLCRIITFWPSMNLGLYSFAYALGFLTVLYSLRGIIYTLEPPLSGHSRPESARNWEFSQISEISMPLYLQITIQLVSSLNCCITYQMFLLFVDSNMNCTF